MEGEEGRKILGLPTAAPLAEALDPAIWGVCGTPDANEYGVWRHQEARAYDALWASERAIRSHAYQAWVSEMKAAPRPSVSDHELVGACLQRLDGYYAIFGRDERWHQVVQAEWRCNHKLGVYLHVALEGVFGGGDGWIGDLGRRVHRFNFALGTRPWRPDRDEETRRLQGLLKAAKAAVDAANAARYGAERAASAAHGEECETWKSQASAILCDRGDPAAIAAVAADRDASWWKREWRRAVRSVYKTDGSEEARDLFERGLQNLRAPIWALADRRYQSAREAAQLLAVLPAAPPHLTLLAGGEVRREAAIEQHPVCAALIAVAA